MAKKKSPKRATSATRVIGRGVKAGAARGTGKTRKIAKTRPVRAAARTAPAPSRAFPMFQVDAFTSRLFHGNPAAVVLIDGQWPDDATLQAVAAENNLAETAFVRVEADKKGRLPLRWFTPCVEMDLCGHATLAAAHVLLREMGRKGGGVVFSSRSGDLPVVERGEHLVLDFPSRPGKPVPAPAGLALALGAEPVECYLARDLLCVFDSRRTVYQLRPDFAALAKLDAFGVIATAPGSGHDFVSRFFAPKAGVNEDPVTGSAHCTLVPYWSRRLAKSHLVGHQVSWRGGIVHCADRGARVDLGGECVTFLQGSIRV